MLLRSMTTLIFFRSFGRPALEFHCISQMGASQFRCRKPHLAPIYIPYSYVRSTTAQSYNVSVYGAHANASLL